MVTESDLLRAVIRRIDAIEARLDEMQTSQNNLAKTVMTLLGDKVPAELRAKFLHSQQLIEQSIAAGKKLRDGE